MYIIGSIIAGMISIGCLFGSVYAIVSQMQKRKNSIAASGVVVGLEKSILNAGSSGVYCPVVEFKTNTGETIRFESSFGTMPASNKEGDVVRVQYNPNNPKEAEIESGISKYFVPGCLLLFTFGSCFFSLIFLGLFILTQNIQY
jgi:hypothetical protein